MDIWDKAYDNTLLMKDRDGDYFTVCKCCGDATTYTPTRHRQMLGNVYEGIMQCDVCNNYFTLDDHKEYTYELYLESKKN